MLYLMSILRKVNWKKVSYFFAYFLVLFVAFYVCRFTSAHLYTSANFNINNVSNFEKTDVKHNSYRQEFIASSDGLAGFRLYPYLDNLAINTDYWSEPYIKIGLYDYDSDCLIEEHKFEKIFSNDYIFSLDFRVAKINDSRDKKYYILIEPYFESDTNVAEFTIGKISNNPNDMKLFINGKESEYTFFVDSLYEDDGTIILFYVIAFFVSLLFFIGYLLLKKTSSLENRYVIIAICVGLCMAAIAAPFFGNDENSHYARALAISRGELITRSNEGGWPITELKPTEYFLGFKKYDFIGPSYGLINSDEENIEVDMEFAGVYSPLSYIASLPGLLIAKIIAPQSSVLRVYLMRIMQLVFCVIIVRYAIKIAPYGKKVLFGVALLPPFLQSFCFVSADALLFACSLLLLAQILEIIGSKKAIGKAQFLRLGLCSVIVSISKLVYFPLVLLLLLIVMNRKTTKSEKFWLAGIMITSLILTIAWNFVAAAALTSGQGANAGYVIPYYFTHPIELIQMLLHTNYLYGGNHIADMMGGTNNAFTPTITDGAILPYIFLGLTTTLIFNEKQKFNKQSRALIFAVIALVFLLICLSLLVACFQHGYPNILGIQGRYFVPLLVPLFFALFNNKYKLSKDFFNFYPYFYLFAGYVYVIVLIVNFC